MFLAEEDTRWFNNAQDYGNLREFVMPFVDAMGNEGFKLNKTRSERTDQFPMFGCFCCCCPVNRCFKFCDQKCSDYDNDQAERGLMTLT